MMQSLLPFIIIILLTNVAAVAQSTAETPTQQGIAKLSFIRPEGPGLWDLSTYGKVNRTEGTPYWNDGWMTGRIRFDGQTAFSEPLNVLLDLEKGELYIRLETGFVGEFPMEMLHEVEVHGAADTIRYHAYDLRKQFGAGDAGYRFYHLLHKGDDYWLLHQPVKYLRREEYIENLGMVRRPDKYMDTNKYWVYDGRKLVEVKKNLRQLTNALPDQATNIKQIVKDYDIDLDKDFGLLFRLLDDI